MMRSPRKKCVARGAGAAWLVGVLLISVQGAARGAEAVTNALVIAPSAEQSADGALPHAAFPELGSAPADGRRLSSSQLERLTASDGSVSDSFGSSVAIDGDTVVAGAVQSNNSGSPVMRGFGENDGWWSSTRGAADSTTCVCAFVSWTFVIARSALTTARPHFGSSTRRSAWSGPSARVVGALLASTANLAAAKAVEPANVSVTTRRKLGYAMTDSNIETAVDRRC